MLREQAYAIVQKHAMEAWENEGNFRAVIEADPEIAKTVHDRCVRFNDKKDEFWKIADVTPALLVCDPRTPEQRYMADLPRVPKPTAEPKTP